MANPTRKPRPETDREAALWEEARTYGKPVQDTFGPIFSALFAVGVLFLCWLAVDQQAKERASAMASRSEGGVAVPPALVGIAAPFQAIPDGRGNYRSAAPTREDLAALLATGRIKYVLRLNGDGPRDVGPLSCAEERALVEAAGVTYVTSPSTPDRFDAHAGYREGRGYVGALRQAGEYLRRGGVLIHCRHGRDRTGAIVGGWLAVRGVPYETIIYYNRWARYAEKGEAYGPYLETVRGQVENLAR